MSDIWSKVYYISRILAMYTPTTRTMYMFDVYLQKNTKVVQLKLIDNSITPLGCTFLFDMLVDNIYITYLVSKYNVHILLNVYMHMYMYMVYKWIYECTYR